MAVSISISLSLSLSLCLSPFLFNIQIGGDLIASTRSARERELSPIVRLLRPIKAGKIGKADGEAQPRRRPIPFTHG